MATSNGGYRTSSKHLDGNYSWYTSGGGDYYVWRYVDTSHALNAIKGKKVKFSFSFDPEVTIVNGGFEESNMSSWVIGGSGDHWRAWPWESHHDGSFSMLIGYNYTNPVANSRDWCCQAVTIPATAKNTIFSFWYHMFTKDYEPRDWFEVYVKDSWGNNLERIFYKAGTYPNPGLEEFGWEKVTYNLTKYAGQTIQLYFAVVNMYDTNYKTWCYVDDVVIENEARAEIYYEYTTSGGGGGCPYISASNGIQYLLDNNLMPSSELTAGDVTDYYLLQQPLLLDADGLYKLMLSEFEEEHNFFDQVQLLAVDHPTNVGVAVSPYGEVLTYVNPHPPVSAITNENKNVKTLLSSIDGNYYKGCNGSYIILNFGDELDLSQGAKLVLKTDMKCADVCLKAQVQNENGEWKDVASVIPRAYWSTEIIDMSKFLPDARGNLKVRLYFTANHKLDFVGLDTSPQATIDIQQAELVSAIYSKNGDPTVGNGLSESDVKSRLLYNDSDYAELMPHEQIKLAFSFSKAQAKNSVRDFIFVSKGYYHTLPPGTLIDPTVYGYWIAPIAYDWHSVEVVVDLPSTTTSVKVIIHGRLDFKAFIDNAAFTICDIKKIETDKGTLAVSLNVISWRQDYGTYGSIVRATVGLASCPNESYQIRTIKLQTELLPSNQDAVMNITYACQANDKNHEIDPTTVKEQRYSAAYVVAWTIGEAAADVSSLAILFWSPMLSPYTFYIRSFVKAATSEIIHSRLSGWASEPENRLAGVGYEHSAVWEQWDYPTYYKEYQSCPFVSDASSAFDLLWRFNKDSGDAFQIKVTAWVNWGEPVYHRSSQTFDWWTLEDAGWTSESMTFTVNA